MRLILATAAAVLLTTSVFAQNQVATLRGPAMLDQIDPAPPIAKTVNRDVRSARNYPEQPPIIPHKIHGYQIDLNSNQCMTCHSRKAVEISQAPMVSITHFMDRNNQFLATISPRRYFCTQCHVPETEARPLVGNTFAKLQETVHYANSSGVHATCPDCHVPHAWTDKIARKIAASKEVWGTIFGTISTPEKFEAHRLTMAQHEWARMEANYSLECRNCHAAESMDITLQSPRAADAHERFLFTGEKTCISCHQGIAHRLPKKQTAMGSGNRDASAGIGNQVAQIRE